MKAVRGHFNVGPATRQRLAQAALNIVLEGKATAKSPPNASIRRVLLRQLRDALIADGWDVELAEGADRELRRRNRNEVRALRKQFEASCSHVWGTVFAEGKDFGRQRCERCSKVVDREEVVR